MSAAGSVTGRRVAAKVVERVLKDGAFAVAALDAELRRHPALEARERALATELSYGTLRARPALERALTELAPRGLGKDAAVLAELLVAAHQLLSLDRVAPAAAVNAAVEGVRRLRGERVAGFVNAVLRRLAASGRRLEPSALVERAPAWLLDELTRSVGVEEARALLGEPRRAAQVSVRVVAGAPTPAWLAQARVGRVSPRARSFERKGDPRALEGYAEGAFVIQEEGAQLVGLALGARPGERVLDACAGRGQKTSLLAEQLGPTGELWATDLHAAKLRSLSAELERLGLPPARTRAVDLSVGSADLPQGHFDRVLVDAPCSGSGTLWRRPEIALRLSPEDPARLGALAVQILRRAAPLLRPEGRLVFAVCSVLTAECEQVLEAVADLLEPTPFDAAEVEAVAAGRSCFRLLPLAHGTDGFFVASLRPRRSAGFG